MNLLKKKVTKDTLFKEYSDIVNGVLQLSTREAEVFSFLLLVDGEGERANVNNKQVRSRIVSKLNISEANLSRYLKVLKDKGLIVRSEKGKWVLNDLMRPTITFVVDPTTKVETKVFELKFVLEIE